MAEPTEKEIDLLLARGRLKGPANERVRNRVLDSVSTVAQPWWRSIKVLLPSSLAFAGIAMVLLLPRVQDGQRSKGARVSEASGKGGIAELTCANGSAGRCPSGSRVSIAFSGGATGGQAHVGAFAEPAGGGERIWYFSAEDGDATLSEDAGQTRLASRSIIVGPEHRAGHYRVHVVLSNRMLSRAEILEPGTSDVFHRADLTLEVAADTSGSPSRQQ